MKCENIYLQPFLNIHHSDYRADISIEAMTKSCLYLHDVKYSNHGEI